MREKKVMLSLILTAFLLFIFFSLSALRVSYNDLQKELRYKQEELVELEEEIAHYESDKNCEMDIAFIERIARERLNLCYPNEIIMEYHLSK